MLHARDLGTLIEPSKSTLNDYLDEWLETAVKSRVRPRTLQGYAEIIDRYIRKDFGYLRLSKVTPLDIQKLYTGLLARGLSPKTVRHVHGVLRSALNQAVKWRLLPLNPALAVDLPKKEKVEMSAFSVEQATKFLEHAADDRYAALFALALTTGMRPGEYLGLKWKDVDLKNGLVAVRRTLVPIKKGGWEFGEPKIAQGNRGIPLSKSVTKALAEHRKKQVEERLKAGADYANHDLVFATKTGEPIGLRNFVNRHFKVILRAASLPSKFRLYDLRHSCATLLLAQGEHPKIVSERLGHASVTLTLDTYSHVLPTMQQGAAEKLEAVLFRNN